MARSRRPGWIDWAASESKKLIMLDLVEGHLPLEETELSSELAWEVYRHQPEFVEEKIPFEQFKERLKDNQKTIKEKNVPVRYKCKPIHMI